MMNVQQQMNDAASAARTLNLPDFNLDWLKEIDWSLIAKEAMKAILDFVLAQIVPLIEKANSTIGSLIRSILLAVKGYVQQST